ncbi:hypothetical protein I9W82_000677 [Candida metapsilosis]|uniref:Uncharacterized protein n=1 Tax=Candida metapsilosis TaxID=273372 RepID=A0A8H7ZJU2_9ASCO|nr:hypothetical protein I9W82_000677 [Candida metapsilosis]
MGYEPVEHLPHISKNISPEERANVEQLVRLELASQFNSNFTTLTTTATTVSPLGVSNNGPHLEQLRDEGLPQQLMIQSEIVPGAQVSDGEALPATGFQSTLFDMSKQQYEEELDDEDDEAMNEGLGTNRHFDEPLVSPLEETPFTHGEAGVYDGDLYTTSSSIASRQGNSSTTETNRQRLHEFHLYHTNEANDLTNESVLCDNNKRKLIHGEDDLRKKRQLG